jgi:hypothetical protein
MKPATMNSDRLGFSSSGSLDPLILWFAEAFSHAPRPGDSRITEVNTETTDDE